MIFYFQRISIKTKNLKITLLYNKNLCSSPKKLKALEGFRIRLDFIWNSHKLILGNTWKIPEAWNNPRFLLSSNVQKGTGNLVEKSSREKFEHVLPKELIQFHFWWSQSLSLGNTQKIWAGQMDPKTFHFEVAG